MLKLGTYEAWFDGEVIVPGETLEERLANLEEWGYQGIQLHRRTAELGVSTLKKALAGSSVQLCIYGGGNGLLSADEETRQAAVTQIKEGLHQAAELGAIGSIVVPIRVPEIPAPEPPRTLYELQCEILIAELSEIAPTAEATGTMVLLEPLNRYESRFLQQLEQAAEAGTELVVLPELHNGLYFCQHEDSKEFERAEPIPGPSTEFLSALAKRRDGLIRSANRP